MSIAQLQESTRPKTCLNPDTLLSRIRQATLRQVRDLAVHIEGTQVAVSGVSRSYYVKQLVTQAVRRTAPQARLVNEVRVRRN